MQQRPSGASVSAGSLALGSDLESRITEMSCREIWIYIAEQLGHS
ncbi:MAG: hypothetical protein ACI9TF_000880 [Paracrocinitomix sp.]|jgi:hypothetical protein